MAGKWLTEDCKELVMKLLTYLNQERDNKGPLLPITAVHESVSDALDISLRTVTRLQNTIPEMNFIDKPKSSDCVW